MLKNFFLLMFFPICFKSKADHYVHKNLVFKSDAIQSSSEKDSLTFKKNEVGFPIEKSPYINTNLNYKYLLIYNQDYLLTDNAFKVAKNNIYTSVLTSYTALLAKVSYGLTKNLSIETGLLAATDDFEDYYINFGLKTGVKVHKYLNFGLKTQFLQSNYFSTDFYGNANIIATIGTIKNNVSMSFGKTLLLEQGIKDPNRNIKNIYSLSASTFLSSYFGFNFEYLYFDKINQITNLGISINTEEMALRIGVISKMELNNYYSYNTYVVKVLPFVSVKVPIYTQKNRYLNIKE